jgi:hypothetical protein
LAVQATLFERLSRQLVYTVVAEHGDRSVGADDITVFIYVESIEVSPFQVRLVLLEYLHEGLLGLILWWLL